MAAAVAGSGVTNQVGLILRRSPAFVWARHLVEAPEAGRVMAVVFRDDQYLPVQGTYGSTWRGDRSKAARARCSSTRSTTSTCSGSWPAT